MAQTAGVINGTDFLLEVAGSLIGHSTSNTLNASQAVLDASNKGSAGWRELKPGQRSWSTSGDGFYTFDDTYGYEQLLALITGKTRSLVRFTTSTSGNDYFSGYGYLTSLSLEAPKDENSTYSYTFEGDGPLTKFTMT